MTSTLVWRAPAADARGSLPALLLAVVLLLSSLLPALAPLPQIAPPLTPEEAIRLVGSSVGAIKGDPMSRIGRYVADYSAEGFSFRPRFGGPGWAWQLSAVRAGAADLPGVSLTGVRPDLGDGMVSYDRGAIVERYLERDATTIEQQFLIPAPLKLGGADLLIAGSVRSPGTFAATDSGWEWRTDKGAVTLGDVTVFDANGAILPASMEVSANGTRIKVDGAALATAAYPVTIDPLVGADDFPITSVTGLNAGYDAFEPSAAYNPVTNQYLVVFSADGIARPNDEFEIYGQFVDAATGQLVRGPFRISNTGNFVKEGGTSPEDFGSETPGVEDAYDAFSPEVAYSTRDNVFLVAWVADNGNPDDSIVWNSNGANTNTSFEVYVQVVSADGELLIQWYHEGKPYGPKDDRISNIVAGIQESKTNDGSVPDWDAFNPAIGYNSDNGEFLICWSDDRGRIWNDDNIDLEATKNGGEFEIRCQRFGLNPVEGRAFEGSIGGVVRVSETGPDYSRSLPANATYTYFDAYTPDVVYAPASSDPAIPAEFNFGQWLIVWAGDKDSTVTYNPDTGTVSDAEKFDIYGQIFKADMTPANTIPPAGAMANPFRNDHRFSNVGNSNGCGANCDAYYPAVAYNPDREHYLVTFTADHVNGHEEVYYSLRNRFGSAPTNGVLLTQLSDMGSGSQTRDGLESDVVYDAGLKQWLVAWRGNDTADPAAQQFRMHGQRLDATTPSDEDLTGSSKTVPISLIGDRLDFGSTMTMVQQDLGTGGGQISETIYQPAVPGNDSPELFTRHDLAPKIAATGSGDYLVVWGGDAVSTQFEVRGRLASFNEGPTVTVPADIQVDLAGPEGTVVNFDVDASDPEDGELTPVCVSSPKPGLSSGSIFPAGLTTVTCTATDSAGKSSSASFRVIVGEEDTIDPQITVPANITTEAVGPAGAVVNFSVTATDNIDQDVAIACIRTDTSAAVASGAIFPLGTTTVECTATDDFGNTATGSFTVTVEDTTAPVITVPANVSTPATDASGAIVVFVAPSASDAVDGAVEVSCVSAPTAGLVSGSKFPVGVTTITCNAQDSRGNAAAAKSFTVTVGPASADSSVKVFLPLLRK